MKRSISSVLALLFAVAAAVGQAPAGNKAPRAGTAPATSSSQSAAPVQPRPSPAPTPTPFNPGLAQLPLNDTPHYSPARLDFGEVYQGHSAKRTLTLTPPIAGVVTFSALKDRLVWLAEYREMGPRGGGSKNSPMGPLNTSIQRQLKSRITYPVGQYGQPISGDVQWNVSEGSEIQIDLVFQPAVEPYSGKAVVGSGPKSVVVQLSGQGPRKPWSIGIPACGVFQAKPDWLGGPNPSVGQTCF